MYNIYQIKLSEAVYDFVNGPEGGHTKTAEKFPEYNTHMEVTMRGSKGYTPEMFAHYSKVCEVANFETEGSKLEEVFKILNGYYFDEDTDTDETFDAFVSGFKMKTFLNKKTKEIRQVRDMHSLSVGDIVEDTSTGEFHIVDGMGFKQIQTTEMELA
jgi:hypothetical protein